MVIYFIYIRFLIFAAIPQLFFMVHTSEECVPFRNCMICTTSVTEERTSNQPPGAEHRSDAERRTSSSRTSLVLWSSAASQPSKTMRRPSATWASSTPRPAGNGVCGLQKRERANKKDVVLKGLARHFKDF